MTLTRPRRLAIVGAIAGALMMIAGPASAAAGSGWDITLDTTNIGRFVTGSGNYAISQSPTPGYVLVAYECHATAGYDPTQTRVRPRWESGCVLYKGGSVVGIADGQSLPGPAAVTYGTANVDLNIAGPFQLCWNVAATFAANGGDELYNSGCTAVNAPGPGTTIAPGEIDPTDWVDLTSLREVVRRLAEINPGELIAPPNLPEIRDIAPPNLPEIRDPGELIAPPNLPEIRDIDLDDYVNLNWLRELASDLGSIELSDYIAIKEPDRP